MNRDYLRKVASCIPGMTLAMLTQALDARELILPPTDIVEAHKPELVRPDGSPLFGPSREQVMMAMGIMPGIGALGGFMAGKSGLTPASVFATSLWTGNSATRTITNGINLAAGGLVWCKPRPSAQSHFLFDTARGASHYIESDTGNAVDTFGAATGDGVSAFNSNGFDLGNDSFGFQINTTGTNAVGWCFKIAPKFFDIQKWTGNSSTQTINHNLGVSPGLILVKGDGATNWSVWHNSFAATANYMLLNSTAAKTTTSGINNFGNNTAAVTPTSTSFSIGSSVNVNNNGVNCVAYLFAHDPTGIIQCGSYSGNGSNTGPSINLGWNPQFVLIKRTDAPNSWNIFDTTRTSSFSGADAALYADQNSAEATGTDFIGLTGSGFQLNSSQGLVNGTGGTYIYMAIKA